MKKIFAMFAVAAFASTATAQGGMAGMKMDEQKAVTQEGPTPPGWSMRPDNPANKPESVNFVVMGPGLHVTSGNTAAIYWNPANTASGNYTISANFGVRATPMHDAIGLVFAGNDLSGDKANYAYFLVFGDGSFAVKHRAGPNNKTDVHTIIAQTKNAAIKAAEKDGGPATNKLTVKAGADSVRFLVNDVEVGAVDAKSGLAGAGTYGFRVNHGISVHIAGLGKQ